MVNTEKIKLDLPDAEVWYYPKFFTISQSQHYFQQLLEEINWRNDKIRIFGKWLEQPRLTALYATNKNPYSYSGLTLTPAIYTPTLYEIRNTIKHKTGLNFESCLLNLYRNGQDSNGWHADDEKELGTNPVIASVSFGEERIFHFRHKAEKQLKRKILLENGSLLLMKGSTQHFWKHQLPKSKRVLNPRINLTFRNIEGTTKKGISNPDPL